MMPTMEKRQIFVLSDATGETAEKITRAALSQFSNAKTVLVRRHHIRTENQITTVLDEIESKKGLIIYTFVSESLRLTIRERALKSNLMAVDMLGPLLTAMSHFFDIRPQSDPGRLHRVDTDYFGRIEAVQFTVKHDDGQNLQGIPQADIVLVGPSRTAKTPLSIYLARHGYKVANVPLVLNIPLPKVLEMIAQERVVALIIDPRRLQEIREARLKKLKQEITDYAKLESIVEELKNCRRVYRANPKWSIVDVTGRAVEEVAADIMSLFRQRELF